MRDANPKTTYLKDYTPPKFLIDWVDLSFTLDATDTRVHSKLKLRKNLESARGPTTLELDGEGLTLFSVCLDGRELRSDEYEVTEESLLIPGVPQGRYFILEIETGLNPEANTSLEGLYISNGMFCTQCEAQGFRRITYFLDRPDVMTVFTTTLVADKEQFPVLLANGNQLSVDELEGNRHRVKWKDPFKKSAYLFAIVAGKLECLRDTHTTCSDRKIDLAIYVEKHDLDKCEHAMRSLKNAMRWDEEVYGREYDLDLYMIVAVGHFNMGAMENKGLNVFNTKYVLARPDTATDMDYEQIEGVIGHEYFHNWTGNRVTCRDWFQLSLKEGLTVFRDQEFTADQTSRGVKRINDVNMLRSHQFAEDAGPMAHPVRPESYIEINNFYTLTVYEKGAEVVRMINTLVGAEGFRKGTDLYFQRHDGQAVTTDDFVAAMEHANQIDLTQFRRWYSQAGTPEIKVSTEYDVSSSSLSVKFEQSCPEIPGQNEKHPLHIPVRFAAFDSSGNVLSLNIADEAEGPAERILELTEQCQEFRFSHLSECPTVSVLRGFSAPVKLRMSREPEELMFLLSYDSDPFNRWEAGQQLACRMIFDRMDTLKRDGSAVTGCALLIEGYREVLQKSWSDKSYLALLLTLPSEKYLSEQMTVIDVQAIHEARQWVKKELVVVFKKALLDLYLENHVGKSIGTGVEAAGQRRLKNTCLDFLNELNDDGDYSLCEKQYRDANNMTDQISALSCIINSCNPGRDQFVADFYSQWKNEPLVIDKWFSLQATSSSYGNMQTLLALRGHIAFDIGNPNRVRSLIGAFSQSNPTQFHSIDGRGYQFLADHVIQLNGINPQVASRMMSAFTQWRRYDEQRQELMKNQLNRILNVENLSKDVYEIAKKSIDHS